MSDGMFLSACREVAKEFPEITYDEDLLDRVCLQVRCVFFLFDGGLHAPLER
jgi:isocitrate/isopropylmalate dehydrogenase